MFFSNSRRRNLPLGLTALMFCLSATPLFASNQDVRPMPRPGSSPADNASDDADGTTPKATTPAPEQPATPTTGMNSPAPVASSATAAPAPASSVVLPPSSVRPTTPLAMAPAKAPAKAPAYKPRPIVLAPPPDEAPAAAKPAIATKTATRPIPAAKPSVAAKIKTTPPATAAPPPPAEPAVITRMPAPVNTIETHATAPIQEPAPQAATPVPAADTAAMTQGANTFGFYAGETRDQIIAAIGQTNVLKQSGDILEVAASPKPDPNFETFLLIVGKSQGLVKLIATGKDIDGDPAGHEMKTQFTALKTSLGQGYGDPSDNFDFLDVKATHRGANQFMLSLTNSERTLAVYWTKKDFGNQITSVSLNGNGLGSEKGYLSLEYEFAGYHDYLLKK